MNYIRIFILTITGFIITGNITAQNFIRIESSTSNLKESFNTAFEKGVEYNDFWIGYSIVCESENQVSIGSFYLDDDFGLSLREMIYNPSRNIKSRKNKKKKKSIRIIHGRIISNEDMDRETAILFRYSKNSTGIHNYSEISLCNMAYNVDLDNLAILWLGNIESKSSVNLLKELYSLADNKKKTDLIPAIGLHSSFPETTTFLVDQYKSDKPFDIREEAVFWLGYQNNRQVFLVLKSIIYEDPSIDMKKRAVMSLGQLQFDEALDELIMIARKNPDQDIRREAVMWLGQKAIKKAEEELKNLVENDPDIEIKKRAVYALANNRHDNLQYLINLANSNNSLQIRKHAIWALGSIEDARAVEALIELADYKK